MSHSRRKLDLMGRRFGRLRVIAPAENVRGRTAWLCKCDCGNLKVVTTGAVRSLHTTSCGCMGSGGVPGENLPGLTYVDGTCVEMVRAGTIRRNNKSGVPGVHWVSSRRRWRASICFKGERIFLGSYDDFEDAVRARREAEERLHGPFLAEYDRT